MHDIRQIRVVNSTKIYSTFCCGRQKRNKPRNPCEKRPSAFANVQVWPLPLIYVLNLVFGLGGTKRLNFKKILYTVYNDRRIYYFETQSFSQSSADSFYDDCWSINSSKVFM
ncbi:predicted protein [Nematostella vectensis]|uniref:Uncharacterized protein n=1 Tax=Nematostella vectensis TaxID=45351 RepID=A7T4J3_NEMVE|nr:predicted protein [Nematostella vectensis]|eukprot:XP_001621221.1 hypothetical protein NEMVEDRAFT_v1g222233 [Nematostella vectensis]